MSSSNTKPQFNTIGDREYISKLVAPITHCYTYCMSVSNGPLYGRQSKAYHLILGYIVDAILLAKGGFLLVVCARCGEGDVSFCLRYRAGGVE